MTDRLRTPRWAGGTDDGAGTLGTLFGLGVFLTLLMFASHLLIALWVTSDVDDIAADAAARIAMLDPREGDPVAAEQEALSAARSELERMGQHGSVVTAGLDPTGRQVVVRIRTSGVHLVPARVAALLGVGAIDRQVAVTRESPR